MYNTHPMKKQIKSARVVVPVTPNDLKRLKALAESKFTDVAELVRQMFLREVTMFERAQRSEHKAA